MSTGSVLDTAPLASNGTPDSHAEMRLLGTLRERRVGYVLEASVEPDAEHGTRWTTP